MKIFENNELTEDFKEKIAHIFKRTIDKCLKHNMQIFQKDFDVILGNFKKDFDDSILEELKDKHNKIIKQKVKEKQKSKEVVKNSKELLPENKQEPMFRL